MIQKLRSFMEEKVDPMEEGNQRQEKKKEERKKWRDRKTKLH